MSTFNYQGKEYAYCDLSFSFMGNANVAGVTAISHKTKRASENIMGAGTEPIAYTQGSKEYEGSMTVTTGTWMSMCRANNVSSLTDVPAFNIVLAISNGTAPVSTIQLEYVRITEDGLDGSVGDNSLPIELPFVFARINADWGDNN